MAVLGSNQGEKCSSKEGDRRAGEVIQFTFLKGVAPPLWADRAPVNGLIPESVWEAQNQEQRPAVELQN